MPTYTQANSPLIVTTPLGQDVLLLHRLRGREAISQLFSFQAEFLAKLGTEVHFDQILGQKVTVEMRLADGGTRYFDGIVKQFSQGGRDENFVNFRAEIVPSVWLLTKTVRSRIFQHLSTPDILKKVLQGFDVSYKLLANYHQRDYCVQYRESDFDFASRLMEEEGIHYHFKHANGSHQMVLSDATSQNPAVPGASTIVYEEAAGELRNEMRVTAWEKTQELRSGAVTLWDHCFELPGNHLEGTARTIDSVTVGKVAHKLNVGGNSNLELYDFPGGYAERFDSVSSSGGTQPDDLQNMFTDRTRVVRIRMEEEETAGLAIAGTSDCGNFSAGHKFTLQRHFDADGKYLITGVTHDARNSHYRSDEGDAFHYENRFSCVPDALRFRPARLTEKPEISGLQTATVVGPSGEEIFVDKYGRIKVQFHWDREGNKDANSSCWLRVAQLWAGKQWGAFFWPRIGHEVVVIFEEGDPDQPLVVGSVYNADNMPVFALPANKKIAGIKSATVDGSPGQDYNAILFYDEQDKEHLAIHSERHLTMHAEYDKRFYTGRHTGEHVPGNKLTRVGRMPGSGSDSGGSDSST